MGGERRLQHWPRLSLNILIDAFLFQGSRHVPLSDPADQRETEEGVWHCEGAHRDHTALFSYWGGAAGRTVRGYSKPLRPQSIQSTVDENYHRRQTHSCLQFPFVDCKSVFVPLLPVGWTEFSFSCCLNLKWADMRNGCLPGVLLFLKLVSVLHAVGNFTKLISEGSWAYIALYERMKCVPAVCTHTKSESLLTETSSPTSGRPIHYPGFFAA